MELSLDSHDLSEFFRTKIRQALSIQGLHVDPEVEIYLVSLLLHFLKSEHFFTPGANQRPEQRALVLKLHDAVFAGSHEEKFKNLKSLADSALYQAGVFYDGLYNSVVDVDYYIAMGGSAYHSLANMKTYQATKNLADIFMQLSEQFAGFVEVLHCCVEQEVVTTDHDLLKLLDRYTKTGSAKAREILQERGIIPDQILKCKTPQ